MGCPRDAHEMLMAYLLDTQGRPVGCQQHDHAVDVGCSCNTSGMAMEGPWSIAMGHQ